MKYLERDVLMYHYVTDRPPYFGVVLESHPDACFVLWWSAQTKTWDANISTTHDHQDRYTTLIGTLPDWVEKDEQFFHDLP